LNVLYHNESSSIRDYIQVLAIIAGTAVLSMSKKVGILNGTTSPDLKIFSRANEFSSVLVEIDTNNVKEIFYI